MTSIAVYGFVALLAFVLYRSLFVGPASFEGAEPIDLAGPHAPQIVAAVSDAGMSDGNRLEVLTDGESFYSAELEAIRNARLSVNIEVYIFWAGVVVDQFIEVLCERARAGVRVNLLLDAFGCLMLAIRRSRLRKLRDAGCSVGFYHPFTLRLLDKINIRTHREIIVVDGAMAFVGGAGIADHWMLPTRGRPWRDMMIRIQGPAVIALQGIFVENWLETTGQALIGKAYFPDCPPAGSNRALVINSSTRGRSSHTQILHRLFLLSASRSITIVTPYFLPDAGVRAEIAAASRRGVRVRILTVGAHTDLPLLRAGGRRTYGDLLEAGVVIYEYEPGMFHVKMLLVDDLWAVIGTTNFDSRSFMINDEINLAVADATLCARLEEDVARDLENSYQIELEAWRGRSFYQRLWEQVSRILERQQ